MPYVFVRENAIKYWCTVQGLNHNEVRVLAEKVQDQPEHQDDRLKRAEFSLPTWLILNALELITDAAGPDVVYTFRHGVVYITTRAKANSDAGIWAKPRGDEYYAWALRAGTTTPM